MAKQMIRVVIAGGAATGGPPLGPALGPLGVNVLAVVTKINDITAEYGGMKVPVGVVVDTETKGFEVEVGIPTAAALVAREAGIEKGSEQPGREFVGNVRFEQVMKIAKIVNGKIELQDLKPVILQVIGTCRSMGVTVDGKPPGEVSQQIAQGAYPEQAGLD
ncbi:MAG: 50S ribosomal protein L11 [Candidatus Geothermarchaeales archaeon]